MNAEGELFYSGSGMGGQFGAFRVKPEVAHRKWDQVRESRGRRTNILLSGDVFSGKNVRDQQPRTDTQLLFGNNF